MRAIARSWELRHGPGLYGAQQARNLRNARKGDGGIPSAGVLRWLFSSARSLRNKERARPVPAAAVIPALQMVAVFIGLKAFVAGFVSPWRNSVA